MTPNTPSARADSPERDRVLARLRAEFDPAIKAQRSAQSNASAMLTYADWDVIFDALSHPASAPAPGSAGVPDELRRLSEAATPGFAEFEVVRIIIPESDDADLPGVLRIGGTEVALVHEKYGPSVDPRYEDDGKMLAASWNFVRDLVAKGTPPVTDHPGGVAEVIPVGMPSAKELVLAVWPGAYSAAEHPHHPDSGSWQVIWRPSADERHYGPWGNDEAEAWELAAAMLAAPVAEVIPDIAAAQAALAEDPSPTIPGKGDGGEDDARATIANLEQELGVTGAAAVFREALKRAKASVAQASPATGDEAVRGLVEALEWYARPKTWMRGRAVRNIWGTSVLPGTTVPCDTHELKDDKGETARTALAAYRARPTAAREAAPTMHHMQFATDERSVGNALEAAPPAEADLRPGLVKAASLAEEHARKMTQCARVMPSGSMTRRSAFAEAAAARAIASALRAAADPSRPDEGQQGGEG